MYYSRREIINEITVQAPSKATPLEIIQVFTKAVSLTCDHAEPFTEYECADILDTAGDLFNNPGHMFNFTE